MIYRGIFIKGLFSFIKGKTDLSDIGDGLVMIGLALVVIACAYLIGSLNFAVIISRIKYGQDIRDFGSGNGGSTNMLRTYGRKMGALTLLCDMLKEMPQKEYAFGMVGLKAGRGEICVEFPHNIFSDLLVGDLGGVKFTTEDIKQLKNYLS